MVEWEKTPPVISLVGLQVACEAYLDWNKEHTRQITKKIYTNLPIPDGHPLKDSLGK